MVERKCSTHITTKDNNVLEWSNFSSKTISILILLSYAMFLLLPILHIKQANHQLKNSEQIVEVEGSKVMWCFGTLLEIPSEAYAFVFFYKNLMSTRNREIAQSIYISSRIKMCMYRKREGTKGEMNLRCGEVQRGCWMLCT